VNRATEIYSREFDAIFFKLPGARISQEITEKIERALRRLLLFCTTASSALYRPIQFFYSRRMQPRLDTATEPRNRAAWLGAVLLTICAASGHSQLAWVSTQPAGPVGLTAANLNGMATARGNSTDAWFEWGADTGYGNVTAVTNIGSSGQVIRVSSSITGLMTGATYHYRLVASNTVGIAVGPDALLATGTRIATWNSSDVPFPAIPAGLSNVVAVACGHGHYLAIKSDGTVTSWAVPFLYPSATATVPADLSNVVAVAGGYSHSLAVGQDGRVTAWGTYLANSQAAFVPNGLSNVVAVAGGDSHSLALKSDGTVAAWGNNSSGQTNIPLRLTNVVAVAAGSTHSLALRADGTVVAWGTDPLGQPTTPPSWLSNVVAISSESWHNLALRADGTVVAWGNNSFGQTNVLAGLSNVVAVSAGHLHSLALKGDGTIAVWGYTNYLARVPNTLGNVVGISSGDYHSLAISSENLPPIAFSKSATGGVNKDLIVSLSGWDPNGDVVSFQTALMPTNGALYQYDVSSGRGEAITSTGTSVTDPSRVVFAPSVNDFGAPYTTFGFVASDGAYNSEPALGTVTILPSPIVQPTGFVSGSNAGFAFGFAGLSNAAYSIQASSNLVNWARLGSATQVSPGVFTFVDGNAANWPRRFYRVISP
jgi:alpha-tubulin suppressor-like RCC1 family protein